MLEKTSVDVADSAAAAAPNYRSEFYALIARVTANFSELARVRSENERIRLMGKFRALSRRSWVAKDTGKHRGVVTRTAESVFGALLYLTEKYGRVFPSLEGLAHLAMCCKQSVVTAVADLEALGFITRRTSPGPITSMPL